MVEGPCRLELRDITVEIQRLVFGLRPSPAILGSTIRHHLDTQKYVNPELIEILKNSFYVDDFISGADDEKKVLDLTNSAKTVMKHLKREERARTTEPVEINAKELLESEMLWLKSIQSAAFETEFNLLKSKKEKNQLINQLNLFLDEHQLNRCQGRLDNSDLPTEVKTPILLPCRHRYTELGIQEAHKKRTP
jgi:hypothetical protein